MMVVDLLEQFKSQIAKYPKIDKITVEEEYEKGDFDNEVSNCIKLIIELINKGKAVRTSWESNAVSFTLQHKTQFVNELGLCIKDLKRKIDDLDNKVKNENFQQLNDQDKIYQSNVCRCLQSCLVKVVDVFKELENHALQKKTRANQILNMRSSKGLAGEKQQQQVTQYKPKTDSQYKTQASYLLDEVRKDRQEIMKSLQETLHMVDMMNIHALQQEDMAISFRDTNILTLQNIRLGKRELAKANQSEGESGEYWMWFFITLTIMIVIIDFVKK